MHWLFAALLLAGGSSSHWCLVSARLHPVSNVNDLRQRLSRSNTLKQLHDHDHDAHDIACGAHDPTPQERVAEEVRLQAALNNGRRQLQVESCDNLRDPFIEIQVNLHLTTVNNLFLHPNPAVTRLVDNGPTFDESELSTQSDLEDLFQLNIDILNQAFDNTPFRFVFMREHTTVTDNIDWTFDLSRYQTEISQAVGSRDLRQMDVFCAYNLEERDDDLVLRGRAAPGPLQLSGTGDGVYLAYQVLTQGMPGDGLGGYEMGYTFVHEVGHWFGLYHPFARMGGVCDEIDDKEFGDFIDDTPVMSGPSSFMLSERGEDCRDYLTGPAPDTCPRLPGRDPIFNYMNYALDTCFAQKGEFTCNQVERMHLHWQLFRDSSLCAANEVEVELVFVVDSEYERDRTRIVLYNEDDETIFDIVRDHWPWYVSSGAASGHTAFDVDVCVDRSKDHYLSVEDDEGKHDGFRDGSLSVYVDKKLENVIEGSFDALIYTLPLPPPPPPTEAPTRRRLPLTEVIAQLFPLQLFEAYLNFGRITPEISGNGPYTVMTTWDSGFVRLDAALTDKLRNRSWGAHLQNLLRYHIYEGDLPIEDLKLTQTLTMDNGEDVIIERRGGSSRVTVNGILVLAPYDATNGFAYMLDSVLLPAWVEQSLLDLASNSLFSFTYLFSLVGLESLLSDPTADLTVFAPNNDALEALDNAEFNFLVSPEGQDLLEELILYHLVPGGPHPSMYFLPQPRALSTLRTSGIQYPSEITLSKRGQSFIVQSPYNEANVIRTDSVVANNGLAHTIDTLLLFGPILT